MDLKLKVRDTIKEHEMIEKGDRVLLALSGGPDSMCLLHILKDLQGMLGFSLAALHVNHSIRGEAADADEAFLKQHCAEIGVPLFSYKIDVPARAKDSGRSLEEEGRQTRYELLKAQGFEKIAVAHNKNDQAETVLMRIIRGTGVKGLCGMEYKREDGVIRPLLDTQRSEIEKYCQDNHLSPRIDATNSETDYTRNKVRLELLPYLMQYNPAIIDSLTRLADSARDDEKNAFAKVVTTVFEEAGLTEDISSVHINSLYKAAKKNVGGKTIEFPHGYKAVIKSGKIFIERPKDK